ncbi:MULTISPECIES: flagellar FlbD family protein [Alicyclobacillus]|uniref:Flagellar FlbD family protein n=1 Tax=Alicyclobacillus acidoterrestris (strain ATCC 49025 / DSM 3922 / CIP 106132 / NCIMB 13137 / GD3B) TaxID=1356854 RepID=T0C0W3_ALIAG|nr:MULTISPECIES: flagellar FlbD family protein [Alicyclobacillus]EPZ46255.1 hypothetical protein N007_07105 [Alicyclobacillus acidoterrestris ATCC 49025]UNO47111.1 flagellar FlbD family protein [Alicyclobacillus acidoterrestris]GEO24816.1 flagellar protein FlbD [Alicyclobacillus acidoterrestris]
MVRLTRLNGSEIWLNPMLIESVEATPDSVITLSNGHKYLVQERPSAIEQIVTAFYRRIGLVAAQAGKGVDR